MTMDTSPWANYAYAVKLQQQQNQFQNNANSVNNLNQLNRNNGTIQQNCYQLNNFNQNQMYTQNQMESLLAHYNNEANGFSSTFNSHHHANSYDPEFISNQLQNQFQNQIQNAKASLSAVGLFKSAKTKDNSNCAANNQLNHQLNTNQHDAANANLPNNFLSHRLPNLQNWMHPNLKNNLNINHYDLNNQPTKPFGVLPHQSLSNSVNSSRTNVQHHNHHSLHEYSTAATASSSAINNNELNGHLSHHHLSKSSCSEPNRHNSQGNKMNHSNNLNLHPMMHQNFMHNNQLSSSSTNNQTINKTTKNQLPHSSTQADQYLLAMNNQQMLMKQFNHQLANRQSPANHVNNQNNNSSSSCVITSNNPPSPAVNHHMNFKNNFIRSQNNSACLIQNQNLMNKTFNNTYCSMVMGGIQINNYNVSNHNNLIISNQTSSNCTSTNSTANQANQVNNFIMNNMNNLQQQIHNTSLLNGGTNGNTSMMNNSNSSRCSSVASVNNLQQINESSSCSYGNFNNNSPSFNNNSNNNSSQNNRHSNSNLSSSQHVPTNGQLNKFNNSYANNANNTSFSTDSSNNNSNATILSVTPGYYPTPPSSVNRSETLMSQSQHSIQSCSQDDQIMQTQFNQNQFNNGLTPSNYNQKVASNNSSVYLNNQQQQHNLQTNLSDNSSSCLMNITPVSDTMSEISKLNDSQCSTNAVNMNLHSQQLDQANTNLQFNNEITMNLDHQNSDYNPDQVPIQSKKKKEKSKKKKKKVNSAYAATTTANYYHSQYHPIIYSDEFIQQQFNQQNNIIMPEEQLPPNDQQMNNDLTNQHLNHSQQQQQQCLDYDNQNCLVNNQSLSESNCINEHEMSLIQQQHSNEEQISNNLLEDKLACLEDDLKYLTESNECMPNFEKEHLTQDKTVHYTSDSSNQNGSIDESLLRHHDQVANDQNSLNGSVNGVLMNGSVTNESPIGDLNNNQFEFEESNLDENYVNINLNNRVKNGDISVNSSGKLTNGDDKKIKKKKKKDKSKIKLVDKNELINGMNGLKTSSIETAKLTSSINDLNLPLKNSIDNSDNSILSKKIKTEIKKDEYEFTDEFNANDSNEQMQQTTKKRKKVNCENVNKKNKSMNSLNEGLIRSFNSTKDEKSSKKLSNKILTSSTKNKNLNSCETSSNSSCSSNSFNLNSKKENQELLIDRNCLNQQNGAIISSKSINLNNQNVVQINNKKIITGKNVNNQLESKKNEVSILNKSDVNSLKQDKKDSSVGSNNSSSKLSCSKLNGASGKSLSNATKRRSGEKKALTIKEGLGRTGDFVISKDAIEKNQSLLWRIEGKSLLQLFKPVEENGSLFYQNTSSYSAWNPTLREKYVGVDVRIMGCSRTKITVEKLSINKSNGNGNMEEKLSEAKDDSLFLPSQHQNDFTVYIQTLISQTLDPHFISEIIEEKDEYFLSHVQKIDEYCLSKKSRIYSKIKWESSIIKCIEIYPKCEAIPQENSGDLRCKFCYEKWSTQILNFTGEMYDPTTLEHIDNDELKLNKYAACEPCKIKVMALSNLLHQKYHFFIKCIEKVEEMREGDENKKSHVILEQSLQDADWIDSLFKQLEEIWSAADKI